MEFRQLGTSGLRSAYGAAGAFVLILLWVYYSTQILLFGAADTAVFGACSPAARRSGDRTTRAPR